MGRPMLRRLTAGLLLAAAMLPANTLAGPPGGLVQIEAVIRAALPPECPILPLVDPPALFVLAIEIDEPPEGDLAIELRLSLTAECVALAERSLQAARDQLAINGLRATRIVRSSNAIVVYYG